MRKFYLIIVLCFLPFLNFAMEEPGPGNRKISIKDLLPREILELVLDYLPGSNKFLNEVSRIVCLSDRTYYKIIQSYVDSTKDYPILLKLHKIINKHFEVISSEIDRQLYHDKIRSALIQFIQENQFYSDIVNSNFAQTQNALKEPIDKLLSKINIDFTQLTVWELQELKKLSLDVLCLLDRNLNLAKKIKNDRDVDTAPCISINSEKVNRAAEVSYVISCILFWVIIGLDAYFVITEGISLKLAYTSPILLAICLMWCISKYFTKTYNDIEFNCFSSESLAQLSVSANQIVNYISQQLRKIKGILNNIEEEIENKLAHTYEYENYYSIV